MMKVAQTLILIAVLVTIFFAFYLRKPITSEPNLLPEQNVQSAIQNDSTLVKATFTLPVDIKKSTHFGILGEGRDFDGSDQPINRAVLSQLFEVMKINQVKAIFFAGNLVSGVVKESEEEKFKPIDTATLKKDLQQFSGLYDSILGIDVPFYPALGDREILIPNGAEIFRDHFQLEGVLLLGEEFLYTVSAGQAYFAVIATDELNKGQKKVEQTFSSQMVTWLEKVLKEAAKSHKYLFVIGYEPAFPSTTTFSKDHMPQRDAFWKVLVDNHVLAYFSSKEHLFDRSNRSGVWQIISGGGGAPLSQGGGSNPFFHCLILTIPAEGDEKNKDPRIKVIDNSGEVIGEFILNSQNQPLYQMRISRN